MVMAMAPARGVQIAAYRWRVAPHCKTVLHECVIVKKKQPQSDARDAPICSSSVDEGGVRSPGGADSLAGARADAQLAKRCLAGDVAAWEQLYAQCHEPLQLSIKIMLGQQSNDANLVDEIAARVWYALVANDGELLARYDFERGARLITFLRALAKDQSAQHFREEVRRRNRELSALRERQRHEKNLGQPGNSLSEFLGTLTPHERVFCSDYLLAEPSGPAKEPCSATSVWQLSHRIYRKLLRFLDAGA
jgi:hypothetical protein